MLLVGRLQGPGDGLTTTKQFSFTLIGAATSIFSSNELVIAPLERSSRAPIGRKESASIESGRQVNSIRCAAAGFRIKAKRSESPDPGVHLKSEVADERSSNEI